MTALNGLLRRALRMSAGLGTGQLPHADETADALVVLNSMVDSWSTNRMNVYRVARAVHDLVTLQASYTIGPTGDFNVARPIWIERASVQAANPTSAIEYPVQVLRSAEEWQRVAIKTASTSLPTALYNDTAFPLATLYVYPVPTVDQSLVLYTWEALAAFAAMTDTIVFPPGYEDALAYNLGVRIAVEWGRKLNPDVMRLARESLGKIQSVNRDKTVMRVDPAHTGSRSSGPQPNNLWRMFQ